MKRYVFAITITGFGETPDEAWKDAVEATNLEDDPIPEEDIYDEYEMDDDEEVEDYRN